MNSILFVHKAIKEILKAQPMYCGGKDFCFTAFDLFMTLHIIYWTLYHFQTKLQIIYL